MEEKEINKEPSEALKEEKKISTGNELIRFIVTGLVCALVDLATMSGVLAILNAAGLQGVWATAISTTAGFLLGVILNYILSTFWVFKNVKDKARTKTAKFIVAFVILSAVAWGLSVGTQELCALICQEALDIHIDQDMGEVFKKVFNLTFWDDATFWCYSVAFVLRTLVGLVWNYFTRKFILYKSK